MPYEKEVKPLITANAPLGCHLNSINSVGGCFKWGGGAKQFDALLKRDHGEGAFCGEYFTATIVSIDISDKDTVAELTKRGFELLGTQKGAHGAYKMGLYGKGFDLPKAKKRVKKEDE